MTNTDGQTRPESTPIVGSWAGPVGAMIGFGVGATAVVGTVLSVLTVTLTLLGRGPVAAVQDVLVLRLQQGVPGQLGAIARRLADAGVNIEIQYSDHDNRLILVVDDTNKGRAIADAWMKEAVMTGA